MVFFLSRALNAIRGARNWNKALDCAVRGDPQAGLKLLDQIHDAGNLALEVRLLRAEFLGEAGKLQECYNLCVALLDEIPNHQDLNTNLQNYATAFVLWIAKRARAKGSFDKSKAVPRLEKVNWEEIDLISIPKSWKLNFPLNVHPDWE